MAAPCPRQAPLLLCCAIGWLLLREVLLGAELGGPSPPRGQLISPPIDDAAGLTSRLADDAQRRRLWSLQQAVELQVIRRPLRCFNGYFRLAASWDAWELIKPLLDDAGYASSLPLERGGYTSSVETPSLLIVPNYWKPGAEDWRAFRLAPYQRINRFWGMKVLSKKDMLVTTLSTRNKAPADPRCSLTADSRSLPSNGLHTPYPPS